METLWISSFASLWAPSIWLAVVTWQHCSPSGCTVSTFLSRKLRVDLKQNVKACLKVLFFQLLTAVSRPCFAKIASRSLSRLHFLQGFSVETTEDDEQHVYLYCKQVLLLGDWENSQSMDTEIIWTGLLYPWLNSLCLNLDYKNAPACNEIILTKRVPFGIRLSFDMWLHSVAV